MHLTLLNRLATSTKPTHQSKIMDQINKQSLFEIIIGSTIEMAEPRNNNQNPATIQIISNELHSGLANFFGTNTSLFRTNLSLEKVVRYKDGSYSSMEKAIKGGFSKHQGYEIVQGLDLAQQIMTHVMPCLNQKLFSIYAEIINQNANYIEQIQNIFIIPELSHLKSISDYLKDVSLEIGQITKSNNLSTATLTNIQQNRINLKKTFYTFLHKLHQSAVSNFFDPQAIADNYLITRYALSNYIVCLVLENIISGNIDDESMGRLNEKVKKAFSELNDITEKLYSILQRRQFSNTAQVSNINSMYYWSIDYLARQNLNNLQSENSNIERLKTGTLQYLDISFEMKRLDDFIKSRHELLKAVEIKRID